MKKLISYFVSLLFVLTITAQSQLAPFNIDCKWQYQNIDAGYLQSIHQGEMGDTMYFYLLPGIYYFSDTSILSYSWSFPGGIPANSNLKNPKVIYQSLGTFDVSLTVHTQYGDTTITHPNYLKIKDYSYYQAGLINTDTYINSFMLNGSSNVSGQGIIGDSYYNSVYVPDPYGYQDFCDTVYKRDTRTGMPYYGSSPWIINQPFTSVNAGSKYPFTINTVYIGNPFNVDVAVWIDQNYDGEFTSADLVYTQNNTQSTTITDSLPLPYNCHLGHIRMRVMITTGNSPTPYGANPYAVNWNGTWRNGEAEDYTLNVLPPSNPNPTPTPISNTHGNGRSGNGHGNNNIHGKSMTIDMTIDKSEEIKIYPNPVKDALTIEGNYSSYIIFSNDGTIVKTGVKSDKVQTDDLSKGVYYIRIFGDNVVTNKVVKL